MLPGRLLKIGWRLQGLATLAVWQGAEQGQVAMQTPACSQHHPEFAQLRACRCMHCRSLLSVVQASVGKGSMRWNLGFAAFSIQYVVQ